MHLPDPLPLSPLSPFLSVLKIDASPRGTGIIPVPIFMRGQEL